MTRKYKKKTLSEEHRKKIGNALRGRKRPKHSEYMTGENNPFYGKTHSEKQKEKWSHDRSGATFSEKTRKRMSKSHIGISLSDDHKKAISKGNSGKTLSEKHKKNISESKKGIIPKNIDSLHGENHWNWKGGISCEPYCEQWLDKEYKQSIMDRDGNMCLNPECNKIINKLCLHHIDYNKKNCHPLNLITVCTSCNSKANKNRRWHKSWYQTIVYRRYIR